MFFTSSGEYASLPAIIIATSMMAAVGFFFSRPLALKQRTIRKMNSLKEPWNFVGILLGILALVINRNRVADVMDRLSQPIKDRIFPTESPFPAWVWIVCLIIVLIIVVLSLAKLITRPQSKYFEEIDFGEPSDTVLKNAAQGLLNHEKVRPFYVHAAPKAPEFNAVSSLLRKKGFASIKGGPGEGKSMVAYHAAYGLKLEDGYRCYRLTTESLEGKDDKSVTQEVLHELDSLKGDKLVIVDDAQNLRLKDRLNFPREAMEGNGKYILIETEYDLDRSVAGEPGARDLVRLDLNDFVRILTRDFFATDVITSLLGKEFGNRHCIETELKQAVSLVAKGKIRDVWHFVFVATRGEARLASEIQKLSKIEVLVLFLISAYAVMSGESELSMDYLLDRLLVLSGTIGWLEEELRSTTYNTTLTSLLKQTAERKSFIRIYAGTHINCLHYRFARAVVRAARELTIFPDLLRATQCLLTTDFRKARYIAFFVRDIESAAGNFVEANPKWLVDYLNNPIAEQLPSYPNLLREIRHASSGCKQVIQALQVDQIAQGVSVAEPKYFQQIPRLAAELEPRGEDFLKALDLAKLAVAAKMTQPAQFQQLSQLLKTLESFGEGLINQLDLAKLALAAGNTEIERLPQLAMLLSATAARKEAFVDELARSPALKRIAETISEGSFKRYRGAALLIEELDDGKASMVEALNFRRIIDKSRDLGKDELEGLTYFLASLDESDRNRLVREIDWVSLCLECTLNARSLGVWGRCAENLVQKAKLSGDNTEISLISAYLEQNKDNIVRIIDQGIEERPTENFGGVARFLASCSLINPDISREVAIKILPKRTASFRITSYNCSYVGQLIRSLYGLDPELAEYFTQQQSISRRILWFFRQTKFRSAREVANVKFLIKVLYRTNQRWWLGIARDNAVIYTLRRIDLPSLYEEVEATESASEFM